MLLAEWRKLKLPIADETVVVAVNFGTKPLRIRLKTARSWSVLFDTHDSRQGAIAGHDQLELAPRQATILLAG